MILQVMSAYDKKARAFLTPFFCSHMDVGVRSFGQAANTPGQPVGDHPQDFALYYLGTYNDENAEFILAAQPQHVTEALQLKKRELTSVQPKVA